MADRVADLLTDVPSLLLARDGEEPDWKAVAGALIARADRVDAELAKIASAFNGHKHPYKDTSDAGTADLMTSAPDTAAPSGDGNEYEREPVGADKGWVT